MEVVNPVGQALYQLPRVKTRIPATRELSIEEEGLDQADFKVFSDGSGQEGRIGAAAVIYKKGRSAPLRHLKAYLGPSTKHNTYEGEAVGGLLANWLIHRTPGTSFRSVSVYIDNQPLIKSAVKTGAWSGQHLVRAFADMLDNSRAKVTIRWISSHSEVKGNEEADKLAKEAAAGKASRREDLPPLLRKTLPTSASATKQEYAKQLKTKWKDMWLTSPRRQRFEQIDEAFPFTKFRKRQEQLSREQASLLMQVRSGHIPLNSFLFRIGKSDTRICQACDGEQGQEAAPETVDHFLFHCRAHSAQRQILARAIGRNNMNLKDAMLTTKRIVALLSYIKKTGRLKNERRQ